MADDSSFRVKNSLVVNGAFVANSSVVNAAALSAVTVAVGANVNLNTTAIAVGSNITVNTTTLALGNSSVYTNSVAGQITISGTTINSTFYQATSFNANNLGGTSLSTIQSQITGNAATAYANAATLGSNATNLTTGTVPTARLSGTYSITANNATNLNGQAASFYTDIPARLGFTPVQQGGGTGQSTNKLYVGWLGSTIGVQVDSTDFGSTWPININGNAGTVTNGVYTTGDQSIAGTKTFTGSLAVSSTAPTMPFVDTDWGTRSIHHNGGTMGFLNSSGGYAAYSENGGNWVAIGNITAFASDARLKTNLRPVSQTPLTDLLKLSGVRFDWREDTDQPMRGTDVGLIAQEVEEVLPEAVTAAPFDNQYKTIKMNQQLVALMIEAIRELSDKVKKLESECK